MFGSQALETAIGLALMFFIFATAASAITEIISGLLKKRSSDLEDALESLLTTGDLPAEVAAAVPGDIEKLIEHASGKAQTSYLSAKSFADAATELVAKGQNIGALQGKMDTLAREAQGQIAEVKAGLETWFDEAMGVAQDKYSKWASLVLFLTGLILVVALNASMITVAQDLWTDSAARDAVVQAAGSVEDVSAECDEEGTAVEQAQCSVENISTFQLPIGWAEEQRWDGTAGDVAVWWLTHLVGWLLTAALLMLGAPFWFDLLGKIVNLRAAGQRPATAAENPTSYSTQVAKSRVPIVAEPTPVRAAAQITEQGDAEQPAAPRPPAPPPVDWLATALNRPPFPPGDGT